MMKAHWANTLVKSSLMAAGAIAITATSSYAQAFNQTDCLLGTVTAGGNGYTSCAGSFSGNDTGAGSPLLTALMNGLFDGYSSAEGVWSLFGKSDDQSGNVVAGSAASGSWSIGGGQSLTGPFVVSLKGSTFYSAYLFDGDFGDVTGGNFNTLGVAQKSRGGSPGLSHASIFVFTPNTPSTPPATAVPEPFTILGTMTAAGIGYQLKRRCNPKA